MALKEQLNKYLTELVKQYEQIEAERLYLVNEAQARVTAIQAEKADLQAEAQEALIKLNTLRVADGESQLTLQDIRKFIQSRMNRGA
jgi:hypothetical protein